MIQTIPRLASTSKSTGEDFDAGLAGLNIIRCMPQILACLRKSESILFALYRLDLKMVDENPKRTFRGELLCIAGAVLVPNWEAVRCRPSGAKSSGIN